MNAKHPAAPALDEVHNGDLEVGEEVEDDLGIDFDQFKEEDDHNG